MIFSETTLPFLLLTPPGAALLLLIYGALRRGRRPGDGGAPALGSGPPRLIQILAAIGFLPPLLHAAAFCLLFPDAAKTADGYAWAVDLPAGIPGFATLSLGLDATSLPLFLLAALVGAAAGMGAASSPVTAKPLYLALLLFVFSGALAMFATSDLVFAYFFHEATLVPAFLLILYWGGQGRRAAAIQMAVYLTFGAMLLLAALLLAVGHAGSSHIPTVREAFGTMPLESARWASGLLLLGTAIPAALFPFHSWAPPTYAEAPTPLSMLHAGVLKKFGFYLLLLLLPGFQREALAPWADVLYWLALGNILLLGATTLGQHHLKEMLASSSVAHMGLCYLGVYVMTSAPGTPLSAAASGSILLYMVGHGLAAAALFLLTHSIRIRVGVLEFGSAGGLAKPFPLLAAFFVAASMASVGLPGFVGFWGELGIYTSLQDLPPWKLLPALAGIVISAVYMLRASARFFFGPENLPPPPATFPPSPPLLRRDLMPMERLTAFLLLASMLLAGFFPKLLQF
ncbi:MAG: NADH-quinone oxidoreductase subunit M [Puniceicoccales bacterium]|jgi:NADH-quinone oxidoreductase subunit M|nr:NADH-quinone oxidoreductase subunit M [Puniceicoccales bacterium]